MPDVGAAPDAYGRRVPALPRALGAAGLLPQAFAAVLVGSDVPTLRGAALLVAGIYGGLILSFLGGLWWGLAAAAPAPPRWLWIAAVAPSLWTLLAIGVALAVGAPQPGLWLLAAAILLTPLVDRRLVALGLAPDWWLRLRVPLSVGLGVLTLIVGVLAWH